MRGSKQLNVTLEEYEALKRVFAIVDEWLEEYPQRFKGYVAIERDVELARSGLFADRFSVNVSDIPINTEPTETGCVFIPTSLRCPHCGIGRGFVDSGEVWCDNENCRALLSKPREATNDRK